MGIMGGFLVATEGLAEAGGFEVAVQGRRQPEQGEREGEEVAEARHDRNEDEGAGRSQAAEAPGGDARAGTFDSAQGGVALLAPARWRRAAIRAATSVWLATTSSPRAQRRGDFAFLCGSSRLCGANSGYALCGRRQIRDRKCTAETGRGAEARR